MADEYDAHEQSERARQWLQKNGGSIAIGILLGLAALLGWQRWQAVGVNHRAEALMKFEQLAEASEKGDQELVDKLLADLRKNYADTPHAVLAAMKDGEALVKAGKPEEAAGVLRDATRDAASPAIAAIASLRLARVEIARGNAQAALDALAAIKIEGYTAEIEHLRGDALDALGRSEDARKAYEAALAATDVAATQRRLIEAKRDDLAGRSAAATPAASPAATAEQG
jgi:predicted negative regulator of RcsB-dependent stress response